MTEPRAGLLTYEEIGALSQLRATVDTMFDRYQANGGTVRTNDGRIALYFDGFAARADGEHRAPEVSVTYFSSPIFYDTLDDALDGAREAAAA